MLRMNAMSDFAVWVGGLLVYIKGGLGGKKLTSEVCGGGGIGGVSWRGAMALMLMGLVMMETSCSGWMMSSFRESIETSENVVVGGSFTRTVKNVSW